MSHVRLRFFLRLLKIEISELGELACACIACESAERMDLERIFERVR
jgi:hypothetical protein